MATMVLQMSTSSVLSTPPATPPMENPANYAPPPPARVVMGVSTPKPYSGQNLDANCASRGPGSKTSNESTSSNLVDRETKPANNTDEKTPTKPAAQNASTNNANLITIPRQAKEEDPDEEVQVHGKDDSKAVETAKVGVNTSRRSRIRTGVSVGGGKAPSYLTNPEEYFRGVSPICRRLLDDMASVKESWGQDWPGLSYDQQCKILDQAIVDEATVRRYESVGACTGPDCEYFPKLRLHTGQNVVRDEKLSERGYTCSWRDEHSAPFSWHTRSQMDLTLDTPPETPMDQPSLPHDLQLSNPSSSTSLHHSIYNCGSTTVLSSEGLNGNPAVPNSAGGGGGGSATFTSRPQKKSGHSRRTQSAFSWHYEPTPKPSKSNSLDIPDVVLETSPNQGQTNTKSNGTVAAHVVVRSGDSEVGFGFLERLRGAFCKLTTLCLPVHGTTPSSAALSHSIHGPTSAPPDLRPPHVLAQANAVSRGVNISTPITLPITSTVTASSSVTATASSSAAATTSSIIGLRTPDSSVNGNLLTEEILNNNTISNNNVLLLPPGGALTASASVSSYGSVVGEVSPTHSGRTRVTTNPTDHTSFGTTSSRTSGGRQKRRAPDPTKKPAPQPPVQEASDFSTFKPANANNVENANETNLNLVNSNRGGFTSGEQLDNRRIAVSGASENTKETAKEDIPSVDLSTSGDDFIPKTGFDFLDNW